jgi:hypothetical protein
LILWSSDPEASSLPDEDQLQEGKSPVVVHEDYVVALIPQSIDASIMALQLIHNVQILDEPRVTIDSANVGIFPALLTNLALEQAIIHCVLHISTVQASKAS